MCALGVYLLGIRSSFRSKNEKRGIFKLFIIYLKSSKNTRIRHKQALYFNDLVMTYQVVNVALISRCFRYSIKIFLCVYDGVETVIICVENGKLRDMLYSHETREYLILNERDRDG